MNSRLFLALCVALFGLFATQALAADTCLGMPLSTKEVNCGGVIPCGFGLYCDKTATCVATKGLAAACEDDEECGLGAMCRGVDPAKVCVAISGPGQACTGDSDLPQADCFYYLSCNDTSKTCNNGWFGDGCTSDLHCASGKCTGGACDGSAGIECSPFGQQNICSPATYCDPNTFTCAPRLTAGTRCFGGDCVDTAVCIRSKPNENGNGQQNMTCAAKGTLAAGAFCDGQSTTCLSGISYNSYCLTGPPAYCNAQGQQCNNGEMCLCQGKYLFAGFGKCGKYECFSLLMAVSTCLEQCGPAVSSNSFSYSNSCANRLCRAAYDTAIACNSVLFGIIDNSK